MYIAMNSGDIGERTGSLIYTDILYRDQLEDTNLSRTATWNILC